MTHRPAACACLVIGALLGACGSSGVSSTRAASSVEETASTSVTTAPAGTVPASIDHVVPTLPTTAPPTTAAPPPTSTPPVVSPAPQLTRFSPRTFIDPQANGVTAMSILVPDGWQVSGGVQWLPFWSRLAFLQTHVSDPATGVSIDWLPIQDFIWFEAPAGFDISIGDNYQGKAYVPPIGDPAEFVRQFWMPTDLTDLQQATVVSVVEVPRVAQEFLTAYGGPAEARAYRLRYAYEVGGAPWERDVSFALLYAGGADITSWYVNFAATVAGPAGSLDGRASLVSTVIASRTTTPEWEGNFLLVKQLFYRGLQQQMADTAAFGRLLAQHRAESQALQAQVTAERQASADHRAEVFRDTLVGVQTYVDPTNGTLVQLPIDWNQYWVNTEGEYLAVDQPGFDPNTLNDGTWQPLVPQA